MNVILPEKFNKKVKDMIRFIYNEHSIINRNMPFMFQKLDQEAIAKRVNQMIVQESLKHAKTRI